MVGKTYKNSQIWLLLSLKISPGRWLLAALFCLPALLHGQTWIQGLSFVAPPGPISPICTKNIVDLGAEYIAVIPYAYTPKNQPKVYFDMSRQWWGERIEGCKKTIQQAHQDGLQVMLKPQVYVPGSWIGDIQFATNNEWTEWEAEYRSYIMACLNLAIQEDVAIFCLGTEAKKSTQLRPLFWKKLIEDIRAVYCGKLTYSANWDAYMDIPFWSDLDFIGISAYFPLSDSKTPEIQELVQKWEPIEKELSAFSRSHNKPILFTEYGYLSVDGSAGKTWEVEKRVHGLPVNEVAQSNALEALWRVFCNKPYWAGGFLWKWFPDGQGHEGYFEKDYTPQGKLVEKNLRKWFDQP